MPIRLWGYIMSITDNLKEFTEALLENYFDSLKEIGNRQFNISASITPYEKFKELRRRKEIREAIKQAKSLIESFHTEHVIHIDTFWTFVEELNIQEVEAKKVLEDSFVKFQNRAWNVIKMLKRRAEDRIDEFEELEIIETDCLQLGTKQSLVRLKDLTFEVLRDSWITQTNPLSD